MFSVCRSVRGLDWASAAVLERMCIMDIGQYVTPGNVTIAAGIAGGIAAIALLVLLLLNHRAIASGVTSLWQGTFSQVGLFYFGMALFMLASIVEAGPVLDKISMHGALFGYGGYLLVFAFDMIAAVCLRARLNAKRVFNDRAARTMMYGIWLPASVSMVSNLAGAFQGFQSGEFNHLGPIAWVLPLVGGVFPSMIVILSLAADNLLDMTAISNKIDPDAFEIDEKKRLRILQIRLKSETNLLEEEGKIEQLRTKRNQAGVVREWFFIQWIRPRVQSQNTLADIRTDMSTRLNEALKKSQEDMSAQVATIHCLVDAAIQSAVTPIMQQVGHLSSVQQDHIHTVNEQFLSVQQIDLADIQRAMSETMTREINEGLSSIETTMSQQITRQSEAAHERHAEKMSSAKKVSARHPSKVSTIQSGGIEKARSMIAADPDVSPAKVVRECGVSRATVYTLKEKQKAEEKDADIAISGDIPKVSSGNGNGHTKTDTFDVSKLDDLVPEMMSNN